MTETRFHLHDSATALEDAVTARILDSARAAIAARGAFHIVLAGGTSPRRIYERLALEPADWPHWHIYLGDERCLPPEHAERNSRMAMDAWLAHVAIPANQIYLIPAERGAYAATQAYIETLAWLPAFDLVLLGLGEDGHTASLFPDHRWGEDAAAADALAVFDAPKPPPKRVSLSAQRLSDAREVLFIVTGASKRDALQRWRKGERIPAASIQPTCGVAVHCDAAAASD